MRSKETLQKSEFFVRFNSINFYINTFNKKQSFFFPASYTLFSIYLQNKFYSIIFLLHQTLQRILQMCLYHLQRYQSSRHQLVYFVVQLLKILLTSLFSKKLLPWNPMNPPPPVVPVPAPAPNPPPVFIPWP